jgi:hypothetical protein
MRKLKKNVVKIVKDCFIVFWLSIFSMILISAIDGKSSPQILPDNFVYISNEYVLSEDTTKKVVNTKELTTKEKEYMDYKTRQSQLEENMKKMEQQYILLDSLLKKDTLK